MHVVQLIVICTSVVRRAAAGDRLSFRMGTPPATTGMGAASLPLTKLQLSTMNTRFEMPRFLLILVLALVGAGCATYAQKPENLSVLRGIAIGQVQEDRILALDPDRLSAADVATLAAGPTPHIILLHGGIYPVHLVMESFGEFLVGMGYPETNIRDVATGEWSHSPYDSSDRLAGLVAWFYEHDGLRPMLVGHSQGGLHAVKIIKELAGERSQRVSAWNPVTGTSEDRTTITDPLTGKERPVIGTSVAYASVVGAGGWALALPHQWESLDTLRRIPDNVDEFTGYFISVDFFALSFPGNPLDRRYESSGKANVRNVMLPATYNHVMMPATAELAQDARVRDWINAFVPGNEPDASMLPANAQSQVMWAADVWYSIKKHWCLEAQTLIRARRAALGRP
jgi:pimeloyl-ACP methyl ester carboxylesterase